MNRKELEAKEKAIDDAINTAKIGKAGSDTSHLGSLEALRQQLKLSLWSLRAAQDSARWSFWASMGSLLAAVVLLLAYACPHLIPR